MIPPWGLSNNRAMNAPDRPTKGKEAPKPKLSRRDDALLRMIEEYAAGLREIIKKLRYKLH